MSDFQTAICWARGQIQSSNIQTVLFVFTVTAVRREAQVGWCRQMFCAAVNLKNQTAVKSGLGTDGWQPYRQSSRHFYLCSCTKASPQTSWFYVKLKR